MTNDKENDSVNVASAVPTITQQELREYVEQARELQQRHNTQRKSLTERLERGATIEPGELTARIEIENKKRWSWKCISDVLGLEQTQELWQQIQPTPHRHLLVLNAEGNDVAWREWRLKNRVCSVETEPPPMPSAISARLPR